MKKKEQPLEKIINALTPDQKRRLYDTILKEPKTEECRHIQRDRRK